MGSKNYSVIVGDKQGQISETRGLDWYMALTAARLLAEAYPRCLVLGFNEDLVDGSPDAKRKNGLTDDEEEALAESIDFGRRKAGVAPR